MKKKEIDGLINREAWKIILKDEMQDDANELGGRFVLAIKDGRTDREKSESKIYCPRLYRQDEDKSRA